MIYWVQKVLGDYWNRNSSINSKLVQSFIIFDPAKRQKLRAMEAASKKAKLTTSQAKLVQFLKQSDLVFTLLVKSQVQENPLDLQELLTYSSPPLPHYLGTPDRFFAKKLTRPLCFVSWWRTMLKKLNIHQSMHIQNRNTLFHSLTGYPPLKVYCYRCWVKWPKNKTSYFLPIHTIRVQSKTRKEHEQELKINLYLMVRLSEYQMICRMVEIKNSYATC